MENKNIFQFDNSGWPDKGDALPEVFIKFPFKCNRPIIPRPDDFH